MTVQLLKQYTDYNHWANKMVCGFINQLEPGLLDKEIVSSFPSIRKTIYHIWDAEVIWLNRLQGHSLSSWPSQDYEQHFAGFDVHFLLHSEKFAEYVKNKEPGYFETNCRFNDLSGNPFDMKVADIIQHCMNHSTFHRGQVVTMLRQLGFSNLQSTDYITYVRHFVSEPADKPAYW